MHEQLHRKIDEMLDELLLRQPGSFRLEVFCTKNGPENWAANHTRWSLCIAPSISALFEYTSCLRGLWFGHCCSGGFAPQGQSHAVS